MDDQEFPIPRTADFTVPITDVDETTPLVVPDTAPPLSSFAGEPDPGVLPVGTGELNAPLSIPPLAENSPLETAREVFREGDPKPFVITLYQSPERRGHFTPMATVSIARAFRTSGLLAALPPEELKTLVALLTFLSPNGDIRPTAPEVGEALGIADAKAEERLRRLVRFRWQARPLVATLWRENGLDGYTLTHHAVAYQEGTTQTHASHGGTLPTAGREAVVARTRSTYARPRAEVERQIAMAQGWPLPEDGNTPDTAVQPSDVSPEEYLRQRLLRLGVTLEQVELLMTTFPMEDIELQIAWLPYRGAKNPASYLVAAITGQYEEPALLKRRREFQGETGPGASANTSALDVQ